jgi:hypothetical protein
MTMRHIKKYVSIISLRHVLGTSEKSCRKDRRALVRRRPHMDELEGRTVLSTLSVITSNFNGTAIPAGDTVWFTSVAKVQGAGSAPVTLQVVDQTISFTSNGVSESFSVPNTVLTLSPTATTATTTFNAGTNTWQTSTPTSFPGNVFLDGVSFTPAGGLPGGIKNVTWSGAFSSTAPGIKVNWQWAAAVYSQFSSDNNALGVKPVDANNLSAYQNSDHAGTPKSFRPYVTGGACGGGGSNYTGSYSGTGTATVTLDVAAPPSASLSGYLSGSGGTPLAGVAVTLIGTDNQGSAVTLTATTDTTGYYTFDNLKAGMYTIEEPSGYGLNQSGVGTVNGSSDGTVTSTGDIAQIVLGTGDKGTNYNFRSLSE